MGRLTKAAALTVGGTAWVIALVGAGTPGYGDTTCGSGQGSIGQGVTAPGASVYTGPSSATPTAGPDQAGYAGVAGSVDGYGGYAQASGATGSDASNGVAVGDITVSGNGGAAGSSSAAAGNDGTTGSAGPAGTGVCQQ